MRLTLAEKGTPVISSKSTCSAKEDHQPDYLMRHPFGRIPAFEHDGFQLCETDAIVRYIDETFEGPPLIPDTSKSRARMTQAMRILDCYAYPSMVWGVYVEQISAPQEGRETNSVRLREAIGRSRTCLEALERLMDDGPFLFGSTPCLADLLAAPMFAYFRLAPKGRQLLDEQPRLERMQVRPSMTATDVADS